MFFINILWLYNFMALWLTHHIYVSGYYDQIYKGSSFLVNLLHCHINIVNYTVQFSQNIWIWLEFFLLIASLYEIQTDTGCIYFIHTIPSPLYIHLSSELLSLHATLCHFFASLSSEGLCEPMELPWLWMQAGIHGNTGMWGAWADKSREPRQRQTAKTVSKQEVIST